MKIQYAVKALSPFNFSSINIYTLVALGINSCSRCVSAVETTLAQEHTTEQEQATTTTTGVNLERIWLNQDSFSTPTSIVPGEWGEDEMCPTLSYAVAFQLKVAPLCDSRCRFDDDVALMGVR